MKTTGTSKDNNGPGIDFIDRIGEEGWTYIKTVVDIVREPVLILGKDLRVMAANDPFYLTFHTETKDTEGRVVYELGNGQWNIPALKKLLEDILPKHTFFKGFEVNHTFPFIGAKSMILNARQIYCKEGVSFEACPPIILLAIEDITEIMSVAETFSNHANGLEVKMNKRTRELEVYIDKLEKEIKVLVKGNKTK